MSEWFKVMTSKVIVGLKLHRGFKSHFLRFLKPIPQRSVAFYFCNCILTLYFDTQFEKNRRFENTPSNPLKLKLFRGRKSKNQNSQTVRFCVFCVWNCFLFHFKKSMWRNRTIQKRGTWLKAREHKVIQEYFRVAEKSEMSDLHHYWVLKKSNSI